MFIKPSRRYRTPAPAWTPPPRRPVAGPELATKSLGRGAPCARPAASRFVPAAPCYRSPSLLTALPSLHCDERTPVCSNCDRLGLACHWASQHSPPTASPGSSSVSGSVSGGGHSLLDQTAVANLANTLKWLSPDTDDILLPNPREVDETHLPESRERRMLEHRLMQHYIFVVSVPFVPITPESTPREIWVDLFTRQIPALALRHENVFYSLMTVSATHLLRDEPNDAELFKARQTYLVAAVRAQREMVGRLNPTLADPVCLCSVLLLLQSFALLGERTLSPYSPPVEWLEMGKGVGQVMMLSVQTVPPDMDPQPLLMRLVSNTYPRFEDELYFDASLRDGFADVLTRDIPSEDDWDDEEILEAYEKTLSYVGSIQNAIVREEPLYAVCRRLQTFAIVIPNKFTELLAERRPRALVILAHFFATAAQLDGVWWLEYGNIERVPTAVREIRAIDEILPKEWERQMAWPREKARLR